jgi:hypothetical protein
VLLDKSHAAAEHTVTELKMPRVVLILSVVLVMIACASGDAEEGSQRRDAMLSRLKKRREIPLDATPPEVKSAEGQVESTPPADAAPDRADAHQLGDVAVAADATGGAEVVANALPDAVGAVPEARINGNEKTAKHDGATLADGTAENFPVVSTPPVHEQPAAAAELEPVVPHAIDPSIPAASSATLAPGTPEHQDDPSHHIDLDAGVRHDVADDLDQQHVPQQAQEPGAGQPEAGQPEEQQPEEQQPGAGHPEEQHPEQQQPEAGQPVQKQPEQQHLGPSQEVGVARLAEDSDTQKPVPNGESTAESAAEVAPEITAKEAAPPADGAVNHDIVQAVATLRGQRGAGHEMHGEEHVEEERHLPFVPKDAAGKERFAAEMSLNRQKRKVDDMHGRVRAVLSHATVAMPSDSTVPASLQQKELVDDLTLASVSRVEAKVAQLEHMINDLEGFCKSAVSRLDTQRSEQKISEDSSRAAHEKEAAEQHSREQQQRGSEEEQQRKHRETEDQLQAARADLMKAQAKQHDAPRHDRLMSHNDDREWSTSTAWLIGGGCSVALMVVVGVMFRLRSGSKSTAAAKRAGDNVMYGSPVTAQPEWVDQPVAFRGGPPQAEGVELRNRALSRFDAA